MAGLLGKWLKSLFWQVALRRMMLKRPQTPETVLASIRVENIKVCVCVCCVCVCVCPAGTIRMCLFYDQSDFALTYICLNQRTRMLWMRMLAFLRRRCHIFLRLHLSQREAISKAEADRCTFVYKMQSIYSISSCRRLAVLTFRNGEPSIFLLEAGLKGPGLKHLAGGVRVRAYFTQFRDPLSVCLPS